jgi:hypothetical protein
MFLHLLVAPAQVLFHPDEMLVRLHQLRCAARHALFQRCIQSSDFLLRPFALGDITANRCVQRVVARLYGDRQHFDRKVRSVKPPRHPFETMTSFRLRQL